MKKIITCFCLSIFVCISILKPIKASAYQVSDQYINGPITDEEYQDLVTAGGLAGILASGAEIVIPDGGIEDLLLDIYNFAVDSEIGNAIWEYCTNPNGLKRDANTIRYYVKGQPDYLTQLGEIALYPLLNTLGEDFKNQYEVTDNQIETNPDVNYLPYIELINGSSFNYQWNLSDNWFLSCQSYVYNTYVLDGNPSDFSYIIYDTYFSGGNNTARFRSLIDWNISNKLYVAKFDSNNQKYVGNFLFYDPINIYINQVNNIWQCTTSTLTYNHLYKHSNNNNPIYGSKLQYDSINHTVTSFAPLNNPVRNISWQANCDTLEDCFKLLAMNFRNVNIYVDGNPWSIITQPPEPIQIGGNTYITGTETPINYSYPDGAWFDPAYLLHLLEEIDYNTQHTLSWVDIAPAFFDDDDQMALYTILIHRNDYDNLVLEQYGSNRLTQSKGLLFPKTELQPYTQTSTFITQSSISLIPDDILTILGGCGVLILIAFLINRLLE